ILPSRQTRWTTRNQDSLVCAGAVLRQRRRLQVEVHIIRNKDIQVPVLVVINKGAACVPPYLRTRLNQTRLLRHVFEGAVTVVAIQRVLAVVGHKQIIESVVVVVAYTAGLTPAGLVFET